LELTGNPFVATGDISVRMVSFSTLYVNEIQVISSEKLKFKNPLLPASTYQIEISQNNLTWSSLNIEINSYGSNIFLL